MRAVPIPGEILRTDVFLGLTFNELITLGSVPLVVVIPAILIRQIPIFVSMGIVFLTLVIIALIVVQTPEGQTPLRWAPAAFKKRVTPNTYTLKPRRRPSYDVATSDVTLSETDEQTGEDETMAPATADAPTVPETTGGEPT